MRGRRKKTNWKLAAATALAVAVAALLFVLPAMPGPVSGRGPELVPVGGFAGRKNIYDRRLRELAVSLRLTSVYARPLELRNPEMIADKLAPILKRNGKELLNALESERSFVWLGRRLGADQAKRIAALGVKGLYFYDEEQRYYPHHETAAHVLGFLSNEQGLAGVEFYYDQILKGGLGRKLPPDLQATPDAAEEKGGANLVLTLDLDLQTLLERELAKARQATKAAGAMGLVMKPASGEIYALVSLPTFDPNRFWKYPPAARRDRVLTDAVYPGGLWNLFRAVAAVGEDRPADSVAGGDGAEAPILAPRQHKTAAGEAGPLYPDWTELEHDIFVSPALGDLPDLPSRGEVGRLLLTLGVGGATGIDLPKEPGSRPRPSLTDNFAAQGDAASVTGLQLLTAFNRLVSVQGTVQPHLLKALWPTGKKPVAVDYEKRPGDVDPAASLAVMNLLRGGSQPGEMAESLFDKRSLAPAANAGAPDDSCRKQDVLLGISRGKNPFTFLLVLDDACIDPAQPSLLRNTGRRLLKWLASPPSKTVKAAAPGGSPPEKLYRQWRRAHAPVARRDDRTARRMTDRMPDVKGLSLRQALQELQPYGVPIEIRGSGRVIRQEPKAGSPLTDTRRVKLELRAN